jgi:hypothetical protein
MVSNINPLKLLPRDFLGVAMLQSATTQQRTNQQINKSTNQQLLTPNGSIRHRFCNQYRHFWRTL